MIRYECAGGVLLAVIAVRNEKRKSEYPIAKKVGPNLYFGISNQTNRLFPSQ